MNVRATLDRLTSPTKVKVGHSSMRGVSTYTAYRLTDTNVTGCINPRQGRHSTLNRRDR